MKLSAKEKLFADNYIVSKNGMRSAIDAGYKESYAKTCAHKMLEKPRIKDYIDSKLEKESEDLGITFEWVANALKQNYQLALTPDGETGRVDVRASSDALKELNKMFGHNAPDKLDVNSNVNVVSDFGDDEGDNL